MTILIFFLGDLFQNVPEPILLDAEVYQVGYGFTKDDLVYLGYMSQITALDLQEGARYRFSEKGKGPEALHSGGPILSVGDKIICFDVMGRKVVRFSQNLKYEHSRNLINEHPNGSIWFVTDGARLYSFSPHASKNALVFSTWETDTFSVTSERTVNIPTKTKNMPIMAFFADESTLLFTESLHVEEEILLHSMNVNNGEITTLPLMNKDYDPKVEDQDRSKWRSYLNMLGFSVEINGLVTDDQHIYLFTTNYDRNDNKRTIANGHSMLVVDRETNELTDSKDINFASVSGRQAGIQQVMKNEEGEIIIAHPRYFLKP